MYGGQWQQQQGDVAELQWRQPAAPNQAGPSQDLVNQSVDLSWLPQGFDAGQNSTTTSANMEAQLSADSSTASSSSLAGALGRSRRAPPSLDFSGGISNGSTFESRRTSTGGQPPETPPSANQSLGAEPATYDGSEALTPQAAARFANINDLQSPQQGMGATWGQAPQSAPPSLAKLQVRNSLGAAMGGGIPSPGASEARSDVSRSSSTLSMANAGFRQPTQPPRSVSQPSRIDTAMKGAQGQPQEAGDASPRSSLSGRLSQPTSRSNSQTGLAHHQQPPNVPSQQQQQRFMQAASNSPATSMDSSFADGGFNVPHGLARFPSSGSLGSSVVASSSSSASQGSDWSRPGGAGRPFDQSSSSMTSADAFTRARGPSSSNSEQLQSPVRNGVRWQEPIPSPHMMSEQGWAQQGTPQDMRMAQQQAAAMAAAVQQQQQQQRSQHQAWQQQHASPTIGNPIMASVGGMMGQGTLGSPSFNDDGGHADHRLSAAMAANAHIGPRPSSQGRGAGGNTTPTIMEEEEDGGFRTQGQGFASPRGMEQPQPQQIHRVASFDQQGQQLHHQQHPLGISFGPEGQGSDMDWSGAQQQMGFQQQHHQGGHQPQPPFQQQMAHHQMVGPGLQGGPADMAGFYAPQMGGGPPGQPGFNLPRDAAVLQQRRYRPSVRPSSFQHGNLLSIGGSGEIPRMPLGDCSAFISEYIGSFLSTPSRLGLGERTVLIMTSKVAQKSYGSEKRFLCPPPMVLLIGSNWWSACKDESHGFEGVRGPVAADSSHAPTALTPPRITVSISGESHVQDGNLEWASANGRLIDAGNPSSEMAISGRCIGRQLYITDFDDKRRTCEALVRITVPPESSQERRVLGTFASKQIKIISKPSKKRQSSRNTELCIHHGSAISLFHRLRSQTVSTRYLCVSGAPTWFKGSDGQPFMTAHQETMLPAKSDSPSCFVAKMSSWDPFVIYLVDPKLPNDPSAPQQPSPTPGFPPMPANAMPMPEPGSAPLTVYYNQLVVLQCLNTAVVSPIMIIRKVERGMTVLGGSFTNSTASGETDGDPVSQLHKIAFEVWDGNKKDEPVPHNFGEPPSPGKSGPFLACLNESVGMKQPVEPRKWVPGTLSGPPTPTTPMTPMMGGGGVEEGLKMMSPPMSPTSLAAANAAAKTYQALSGHRTAGSDVSASSDGSKTKRPRRVSSSIVQQKERAASAAAKGRRRGQSLSMLGIQAQQQQQQQQAQQQQQQAGPSQDTLRRTSSSLTSHSTSDASTAGGGPSGVPSGALWTIDVGDSDTWTIVGTDIARHTFYIPPKVVGGVHPQTKSIDATLQHLLSVPAPAQPITPVPTVENFVPAGGSGSGGGETHVTLFGQNFSEDLFVFFGDFRSEHVEVQSPTTMLCSPPPSMDMGSPRGRVPIVLVRKDGVIFPTEQVYDA